MKIKLLFLLMLPALGYTQSWHESIVDSIFEFNWPDWPDNIYSYEASCDFIEFCDRIDLTPDTADLWQIGSPQKPYFDTAYVGTKSLLTDTINPYPVGSKSSFILDLSQITRIWCSELLVVSFHHKIDTDSLLDGGYIEYSGDNGTTWYSIFDAAFDWQPAFFYNMYGENDTLYNGTLGFSGKNDWIESGFLSNPHVYGACFSNIQLRFTFISDSTDNPKDGWMIDNINIYRYELIGSVNEYAKDRFNLTIYPNPVRESVNVSIANYNYLPYDLKLFDATGREVMAKHAMQDSEINLSCGTLQSGVYSVVLLQNGVPMARDRIVIE